MFKCDSVCVGQTIIDMYLTNKGRAAKEVLKTAMKDKTTYLAQQAAADIILAFAQYLVNS